MLEPVGCHRYVESVLRWEVGQESLKLKAVSHEMTAFILSPEIVNDLNVSVYTDHNATLKATYVPFIYIQWIKKVFAHHTKQRYLITKRVYDRTHEFI